jgi:uncharacterized membrane protein
MLKDWLILVFITFLPFVELRLSIPVGILTGTIYLPFGLTLSGLGLNPLLVFITALITNIILGFLVFNLVHIFDKRLRNSRIKKPYSSFMDRSHRKIGRYTEKYGTLGVAIFIGLPIPGSGVYMGSLGAFMLGLKKKQFYLATILGVTIAASIVTILTVTGKGIFG